MAKTGQMIKVSVCMATRNGGKYIFQQLGSILGQLDRNDEVIISDDSSSDNTVAIIKSFRDDRVRLLENNTFYSPTFNLENALKKASGEIIVLSDQDDIWLQNRIDIVRRYFVGQTGLGLIMMDGMIIDDNEHVIHDSIFRKIGAGKGLIKNIYDNTYMGCCLAFRRELLAVALPFPRRIPMHDMWLGILAELFGTVEFVGEKTIKYRRHQANVSVRSNSVWQQIKRRIFLSCNLVLRYAEIKYSL